MKGIVDLVGAISARALGVAALIPLAASIESWIAFDPSRDSVRRLLVALVIMAFFLAYAAVLISPGATRRLLRRRASFGARLAVGVVLTITTLQVMVFSANALPRLDPNLHGLTRPIILGYLTLGGIAFLMFVLPGSYARRLAMAHDPASAQIEAVSYAASHSLGEAAADLIGAATARILGLLVVIHPALVVAALFGGGSPPAAIWVVTAVFSAGVAFVFLVPGQTRSFFTPKPGSGARFGFGLLSMVALSIALGLTAFSVGSLAPEDRREEIIGLIGGVLQVVTILFLVMFFVPGYYATRLRERAVASAAAQREADRRAAIMAAVRGDPEVQTTAAGDWQARLSAYESRRTSAPARQPEPQTRRQPPRRSFLERTIAFVGLMPVVVAFFVIFYADAMAQFVPTAELAALIPQVRVPLAIALTVLCIAGALTAETNRAGAVKNTPLRIILFGGIGALVGLFGAESLLARGLPGLHSFFVSAPASQITLEVTEIGSERVRRGCDYTVYARGVDYVGPESTKLCEVGAEVWAGLQVGNRIVLNGYATPFGFRYDRVTK